MITQKMKKHKSETQVLISQTREDFLSKKAQCVFCSKKSVCYCTKCKVYYCSDCEEKVHTNKKMKQKHKKFLQEKPSIKKVKKVVSEGEKWKRKKEKITIKPLEKKYMFRALESYKGMNPGELTFERGDLIQLVSKGKDGGGWVGILNGKKGLFPENIVEITTIAVEKKSILKSSKIRRILSFGKKQNNKVIDDKYIWKALYPFKGIDSTELTFEAGDIIELTSKGKGDGWWTGTFKGDSGKFPESYVELTTLSQEEKKKRKSPKQIRKEETRKKKKITTAEKEYSWKTLYPFKGQDSTELTFKEGDLIQLVSKGKGDGWWIGILNRKRGLFPGNYVKLTKIPIKNAKNN
ncbi:endophilin-a [Anaeramoeba flamelloides]|uniref:Endophilin-a n=1 Tax=Anaeramoeba flamelloides TaxID=1746091 RepID=A0ABQ8Y974_9EUKA|nr:endophilin-a [Anaeramoeba flamelloides]